MVLLSKKKRPIWVGLGGGLPIPAAPSSLTTNPPPVSGVISDTTPDIVVGAVTGAATYQFQVSTVANFASTVADVTQAGTTYTVSPALDNTLTYYTRVRAFNSGGVPGAWSDTLTFSFSPWYRAGEAPAPVGAYQAIGVASYAASLVNLANPGTNDLVVNSGSGTQYPPQWTQQEGWRFSDLVVSSFNTGLVPDTTGQNWSMIVWFADGDYVDDNRVIAGKPSESGGRLYLIPNASDGVWYVHGGGAKKVVPGLATGCLAIAGNKAYRNGTPETGTITAANAVSTIPLWLGRASSYNISYPGVVRMYAVYNTVLSDAQVLAITNLGNTYINNFAALTNITTDAEFGRSTTGTFILDSDLGSDCDDAGCIAVIHRLMTLGSLNMIAIVNERTNQYAVSATDAINTYYGRGDIPIGANKGSAFLTADTYAQTLATTFTNDLVYADAPEAVALYRQTLAAQSDPIRLLCVGPLRLLHQLLISPADGYSALTGMELVTAKVAEVIIMGGFWPDSPWAEYNLRMDATASNYVFANCPVPLTILGAEIADFILAGNGLTANTPVGNPVRKAYELHVGLNTGRPAWDTIIMLYLVYGLENGGTQYFTAVRGTGVVNATTGMNTFTPSANGNHAYLRRSMSIPTVKSLLNTYLEAAP